MTRNPNLTAQFIRQITGMTENDYNDLFFDSAVHLLQELIPQDNAGRKRLADDEYFWTWYKKSFDTRNHLFVQYLETELADYFGVDVTASIRERFEFAHSPDGIRSYQKRVPFYIIDVMYKKILYGNKETEQLSELEQQRVSR